jgi:hypothetical protein
MSSGPIATSHSSVTKARLDALMIAVRGSLKQCVPYKDLPHVDTIINVYAETVLCRAIFVAMESVSSLSNDFLIHYQGPEQW